MGKVVLAFLFCIIFTSCSRGIPIPFEKFLCNFAAEVCKVKPSEKTLLREFIKFYKFQIEQSGSFKAQIPEPNEPLHDIFEMINIRLSAEREKSTKKVLCERLDEILKVFPEGYREFIIPEGRLGYLKSLSVILEKFHFTKKRLSGCLVAEAWFLQVF
ncbi:hypothetical protein KAU11_03120 [Candidatus Babeliales bacterium]|nr:hypothetical protein [Candidatus Babeliales bacterium]